MGAPLQACDAPLRQLEQGAGHRCDAEVAWWAMPCVLRLTLPWGSDLTLTDYLSGRRHAAPATTTLGHEEKHRGSSVVSRIALQIAAGRCFALDRRTEMTPVKKLFIAAMIAAFSAAVVLPVVIGSDAANAATTKKKKKKGTQQPPAKKPSGTM